MKKIAIIVIVLAIIVTSCQIDNTVGDGPIITQELIIDDFNGIETYGEDRVNISYSEIQKVTVTGHANIIEKLERDVKEGIWEMELENGSYKNAQLTFNIQIPLLNKVEVSGSGNVEIADFTSNKNVEINLYGSGNIIFNGNTGCENLEINMEGSGNIYALGSFKNLVNLNIDIEGSGGYDGFSNKTMNSEINITGSSVCNVKVENLLKVIISGSGVVNYKENPTINSNIIGSGRINNYND